ncbi:tRNA pseudouridine(13) synthase TruD [archaeon]|nr:tRNA pseudouridine(13) synthase TruD [archaeon]
MKLKSCPEDFIVKEKIRLKLREGTYSYFLLEKRECNTQDAISIIAKRLNINPNSIGFSGNKDKHALTYQYISIPKRGLPERIIETNKIKLRFIGSGKEPIYLGRHYANEFIITIRELTKRQIKLIQKVKKRAWFINYFDEQRFGIKNAGIGKALIKKQLKKACGLLFMQPRGNDFVNCLRQVPAKKLKFYMHAYQSYLWNLAVSRKLEKNANAFVKVGNIKLAVPKQKPKTESLAFPSCFMGKRDEIYYKEIFNKQGISKGDFLIRQFPELTSEPEKRKLAATVKNFKITDIACSSASISFTLPKGCYATMFIKQMLSDR